MHSCHGLHIICFQITYTVKSTEASCWRRKEGEVREEENNKVIEEDTAEEKTVGDRSVSPPGLRNKDCTLSDGPLSVSVLHKSPQPGLPKEETAVVFQPSLFSPRSRHFTTLKSPSILRATLAKKSTAGASVCIPNPKFGGPDTHPPLGLVVGADLYCVGSRGFTGTCLLFHV